MSESTSVSDVRKDRRRKRKHDDDNDDDDDDHDDDGKVGVVPVLNMSTIMLLSILLQKLIFITNCNVCFFSVFTTRALLSRYMLWPCVCLSVCLCLSVCVCHKSVFY